MHPLDEAWKDLMKKPKKEVGVEDLEEAMPFLTLTEELEKSIVAIAGGMKALESSLLKADAIEVLLWNSIPLGSRPARKVIRLVMQHLAKLQDTYMKKEAERLSDGCTRN